MLTSLPLSPNNEKREGAFLNINSNQMITEQNRPVLEAPQLSTGIQEPFPSTREATTDIRITIPANNQESLMMNSAGNYAKRACFLRKICALLASTSTWIVLTLNETDLSIRLENLFMIACCCIIYITFENIFFCMMQELAFEDFKERLFEVLDGFLALYFLIIIMCYEEGRVTKYLLIVSPCLYLVLTSMYVKAQLRGALALKNRFNILRRLFYTIQVWMITAKILDCLTFSWMTIFMPLSFLLLGHQIYGSYTLIKSAIKLFRQMGNDELNALFLTKRCVEMSWHLLCCGLYPLTLLILLIICQQAEDVENEEFMRTILTIVKYYSSFFLGYTLVYFQLSKKFYINVRNQSQEETKKTNRNKRFSIKVQKQLVICYFKRISSTFFILAEKNNEKSNEYSEEEINDSRSTENEESLCYICETNVPDIILGDCGHGGLCKECMLISMKKNTNCLECRRPVQSIYQIKNEDMKVGVVEAVEAFSIV